MGGVHVTVRVFGHYSDALAGEATLNLPVGATAEDAARALIIAHPRLAGIERVCRVAINEEYSEFSKPLESGDSLAFIPPMSGG